MIIKKYLGKTEKEATTKAREDLGPSAVIMNVKIVHAKGVLRFLKKQSYEVTAAIEEEQEMVRGTQAASLEKEVRPKTNVQAALNAYQNSATEPGEQMKNSEIPPRMVIPKDADVRDERKDLEQRIDTLQQMIENQFTQDESNVSRNLLLDEEENQQGMQILKMIYRTLIENEVDERYANQLLDEITKTVTPASNLDYILSNVYQKLVLKFGQSNGIRLGGKSPKVVFFIGPTGVGKTTTIAKIASQYKVEQGKKIALATSDTYRIAATDQLQIYANILNIPMVVVYSVEELNQMIQNFSEYEMILVDTAGFSHNNEAQRNELTELLRGLDPRFEKEVYLVVSATTKYRDLAQIVDSYTEITDYKLIFTKLDETVSYGNLLNIRMRTGADMSYLTTGQNVPDDIEVFNAQKIVKQLLGGK